MEFNDLGIDLKTIQDIQLEILIEFDKICRQNNIKYQLFAGTLLGAVRHKGFIPWDDDVDVCMLREDYKKFLKVCNTELDNKYFLQTYETDKRYIHSFARIRKNNTLAVQEIYSEIDMHYGIFIDVFPLDNVSPNTIKGKLQRFIIYPFRNIKRYKIKKRSLNSSTIYKKWVKLMIYYSLKLFSIKTLNKLETRIACIFEKEKTTYITTLTDAGINEYYRYMSKRDEFYNVVEIEFEGKMFLAPRNYEEVLNKNFGDYMSLPPLEDRIPHHGLIEVSSNAKSETEFNQ